MRLQLYCRPDGCPGALWQIMSSCWAASHKDRPTFAQLVAGISPSQAAQPASVVPIAAPRPQPRPRPASRAALAPAQPDDGVARQQAVNVAALEALRLEQQKFDEAKRQFALREKEIADRAAARSIHKEREALEHRMAEQVRVATEQQRRMEEARCAGEKRRRAEIKRVAEQQRQQAQQRRAEEQHRRAEEQRRVEADHKRAEEQRRQQQQAMVCS